MSSMGSQLASFLPVELLGRLRCQGGDLPATAEFPAAVMFVDVSRYTALVEQLARRGQGGLERIPDLLSRSYARCIEEVSALRGEVLSLAGDTLIAYWPADSAGLGNAARAAADCAKRICADRNRWPDAEAGGMQPALHVGVGAGRLWAAAVGGSPNWNLVAGGEAVFEAARAQSTARRWEYVLSETASRTVLEPERSLELGPDSPPKPSVTSMDVAWMAGFLPPQLRDAMSSGNMTPAEASRREVEDPDEERLKAARLDALAEIRPITALFARVTGLDYRDPQALGRHQTLCAALQEVLRSRGGPTGELVYDDKGLIFLATFGAHGSFHRDDASRAVDAAKTILHTTESLGLSASIGVATGDALFRVVGNSQRRQFMVIGAPMNRAARLMTAVSGDILCDAPTERASRSEFQFETRGTLQLVGLGDTAAVFRPLERRTSESTQAALFGRQNEMDLLKRAFGETLDGSRRLVAILGAPGIGKSRLVDAFIAEMRDVVKSVSVARAERDDRRTSFLPWRRVLASILGLAPSANGFAVHTAIAARVQSMPILAARLPLLGGVLGIEIPQPEAMAHLEGAHRADATMRLLAELIDALAPRPFIVVLEDGQWLDSASWRLVEWILASLSSLLLILCVRSEEVPDEFKTLRRRTEGTAGGTHGTELEDDMARVCRVLELEELGNASLCELVARTLGSAPPQDELARQIAHLSTGNPLFAEEIALSLKSEGLIAVRDGVWQPLRPLDGLRYFEGVERVIRERVDRLDVGAQTALKAAAVIGRSFSHNALAALSGGESQKHAVAIWLESLVAAQLIRDGINPGSYEFRHDKIRDVVYGSIPSDLRQRLHGSLAEWIESTDVASTGADSALLVQHFQEAGNKDKAVKYADLAATNALQIGAYREVESFLDICFSHEPRQQPWSQARRLEAVRWRRQLGQAHYALGNIRAQGIAIRRALTLANEPVPESATSLFARLLQCGVRLALQQVFPPTTSTGQRRVQASWEQELTRCLNQAAIIDYFELRFTRAFYHTVAAALHGARTGLSVEMVVSSGLLACGLGILGLRQGAHYFMSRAENAAVAMGDTVAQAQVCHLDALWLVGHCEWETLDRRLDKSQSLALEAGDQLGWCNSQAVRFWSLHYRGDLDALERTAHGLLSRAQNSGNLQQEVWALRCKALCALQAHKSREAVDILRLVVAATPESADLSEKVATRGMLALALARVGLHAESVERAVETLRTLRTMRRPTVHSTLLGISGIVEVFLRGREAGLSSEYNQWRQWERRALAELRRYSRVFKVGKAQYGLWSGVALWLNGRHRRAVNIWNEALATAQSLSLRQDESTIAAELRRRQD